MNAQKVIAPLKSLATDERKMANEQFFKTGPGQYSEHDRFIGVRVPQTRSLAKKNYARVKKE